MPDLFPAFYFHPEHGQQLFASELALKAAGPGWADTQFPPKAEPAAGQSDAGKEVIASRGDESRLKRKTKG